MKKLVILFSCLTVLLITTGKIFDKSYKKFWWSFFEKFDVAFKDSSYYDGIFLGDSRVHFGINPYYVDSVTGLKTYNIGVGGANIQEINFLGKMYLEKHPTPKFAVISVGYTGIIQTEKYFNNPCYYLFYTDDTSINNKLANLGYHTTLYKILPFLKYTAFDDFNKFTIVQNFTGKNIVQQKEVVYHGFINSQVNIFNVQAAKKSVEADTSFRNGIEILSSTIEMFRKKNIKVVLVYPPDNSLTGKGQLEIKMDAAIDTISKNKKIPLLKYDKDSAFIPSLFTDQWHLNLEGTILYSKKLGEDIKEIMERKK